jgi:hypothetical protein
VARLLSGTPDLDPQHLRDMIDRALDRAQSLRDRVGAIRCVAGRKPQQAVLVGD